MSEDIGQLKEQYLGLFGDEGVSDDSLGSIESSLGISLPDDAKEIASFYGGGMVGGVSHHAFASEGPANNVVDETKRLRDAIQLLPKFVVLAEPANSLIVLDTSPPSDGPVVMWCDAQDATRLGKEQLASSPDVWNSYTEFFAYLLEEEEDER